MVNIGSGGGHMCGHYIHLQMTCVLLVYDAMLDIGKALAKRWLRVVNYVWLSIIYIWIENDT